MNMISRNKMIFYVCFLGFTQSALNAQIGGPIASHSPKQLRTNTTVNKGSSNKKLAVQITKNSHGDLEKAKAIFVWIATHISYDNELRNDTQLQKQFYTSEKNVINKVLERKKGLCGGYALLFKDLCKQIGIHSEVIHGFSKKYVSQPRVNNKPDHSWNSLKINGKYYLLDLTLAVSHSRENMPNMYWFCTNPDYFIKTHYPEDKKWALLANPISRAEFENLPIKNP